MTTKSSPTRYLLVFLAMVSLVLIAAMPVSAVTLAEEVDLGRKLDVEILKQTPLSSDDDAQNQMEEYGKKLAKGVRRTEIAYHFKIIHENEMNAFSIPGGYVYFTDKLWNVMTKDERIGVLAHEIIHVDRRHALDAISKRQRRQIWMAVLLTGIGANETWGNLASLAESMYTLKYSRGDEQQADEFGIELTQKAGYNPAGLLLAMRKIKRFEDDSGGAPPKIFSSHPPTKERLAYMEAYLKKKGIPFSPEQVKDIANPYKIGEIATVNGDNIEFTSTKTLQAGDVVWVMGYGWDYKYENKTAVPMARVLVKSAGTTYSGRIWRMSTEKKKQIAKGAGIFDPPTPQPPASIGRIEPISTQNGNIGKLSLDKELVKLDRLMAVQTVWDREYTKLVNGNIGYLVIRDPNSPTDYVAVSRPGYSYAPLSAGAWLVPVKDPEQQRWVGPIISIGRSGETIEVLPNRTIAAGKVYDVVAPQWGNEDYKKRVIGTARLQSTSGKIVLRMTGYTSGHSMDDVGNGFDVYEGEVKR